LCGPRKSQGDEFYVDLVLSVMAGTDSHTRIQSVDFLRDCATVRKRVTSEGLSFLTRTLPKLGKALDQGLVSLRFKLPREFKHSHGNRNIPAFGQASFNRIFDSDGIVRAEVPGEEVQYLRQVLYVAYKLQLDYPAPLEEAVIQRFRETEEELKSLDLTKASGLINHASVLAEEVFRDFDPMDIVPRHGPGAVATGEQSEEKWVFTRKYSAIHRMYPYYDYFVVGGARELVDRLHWYHDLTPCETGCAKVVLVPKDSRGPRLISCEPLEYQWIQQGLGRKLVEHLESNFLTRGQINFTCQSINRDLAFSSSSDGKFATLDLKDASDRVSLELVRSIFKRCPKLLKCLEACRTTATLLPNGEILPLAKFAPMGSALCFPVEAFCFWALSVAAIQQASLCSRQTATTSVFVYGDDIICRTPDAGVVVSALTSGGLLVNQEKSCISGNFRESCGMDAFRGMDVTPSRLSVRWSGRASDGAALSSYSELANALQAKGFRRACSLIWDRVQTLWGFIPFGSRRCSVPHKEVDCLATADSLNKESCRWRYIERFQRIEFNVLKLKTCSRESKLDNWPRLLRNLVSGLAFDPSRYVVPRSTQIKRGWVALY